MRAIPAILFSIGAIAASISFVPAAVAQADQAEASETTLTPLPERDEVVVLIASYEGDWVARGTTRTNFNDPLEAASCRMSSVFDAATQTLSNDGRCASTQRALELQGDLSVTPEGELDGGYFNRFDVAELQSSTGTAYEEGFIIEAVYLAEFGGETQELDAKVSVGRPQQLENGDTAYSLVIEIVDPDTAESVVFSELVFTLRD